ASPMAQTGSITPAAKPWPIPRRGRPWTRAAPPQIAQADENGGRSAPRRLTAGPLPYPFLRGRLGAMALIEGVMRAISDQGQGRNLLSCPLSGFSRSFDDGGPSSVPNNQESPGKPGELCRSAAHYHQNCGRTAIWHGFFGAIWHHL